MIEVHGIEHWTHYYTDYGIALQKRFFDHFLKGENNGWEQEPKVELSGAPSRRDGSSSASKKTGQFHARSGPNFILISTESDVAPSAFVQ